MIQGSPCVFCNYSCGWALLWIKHSGVIHNTSNFSIVLLFLLILKITLWDRQEEYEPETEIRAQERMRGWRTSWASCRPRQAPLLTSRCQACPVTVSGLVQKICESPLWATVETNSFQVSLKTPLKKIEFLFKTVGILKFIFIFFMHEY